ncbi:MAG: NAD(P)H-dependent oxidoreductase [Novosphingobium sp.]
MPRLLHIQSSPNLANSITRSLSDKFVETWTTNYAGVEVDRLDLEADPLPHFDAAAIEGLMPGEEKSEQAKSRAALSDRLIGQLEAADILVIGAPMINFSISTQLKAWFDYVSIAGRTFRFAAPGIAKGLLFGKKAFVVLARGGDYADFPANAFDHHEPLIRTLLGFLGIYDVSFIRAEGMRAKEEEVPAILANAEEVIARLAA